MSQSLTRYVQRFASDTGLAFSKSIGWFTGDKANRYAIAIDHGKVVYAGRDTVPRSTEKSGADAVLAVL